MKMFFTLKTRFVLGLLFSTLIFSSCKKDSPAEFLGEEMNYAPAELKIKNNGPNAPSTVKFSKTVNWNNRIDGLYNYTFATQDFGSVTNWDPTRSSTVGGALKVTLLANTLSEGGLISRMDVTAAAGYEISYDMKFGSNFDWSAGGKVGFGFLIGDGQTGGTTTADGTGGSIRLMWNKNAAGRVYLKPYIYHKDQPGTWGDDFAKTYPATGSIAKDTWYNVKIYVRSNTGSNTDGYVRIMVNGVAMIDQPIRYTTVDAKRMINRLCFENFRGGSETYWQSATNGDMYFDNVTYTSF